MITTHVLDIAEGIPAAGMNVILEVRHANDWSPVGRGTTNEKGRVETLTNGPITPGTYRLTFNLATYHKEHGLTVPFFPEAKITFNVRDTNADYHVPLVISPYGYSTYRGT